MQDYRTAGKNSTTECSASKAKELKFKDISTNPNGTLFCQWPSILIFNDFLTRV